jgi:hypothetical protein
MGVVMSALLTAASEADLQERRAPPPAGAVPVPHVPCPRAKPPPVPSASQEEYAKIIWKEYNVNYDSGGTSFYPYVVEARREPRPMRPALRATRWLVAAVCVPTRRIAAVQADTGVIMAHGSNRSYATRSNLSVLSQRVASPADVVTGT